MFRFAMQHGGISPTGNTLLRENGSNRLAFGFQGVETVGPGTGKQPHPRF